MQPMSIQESSRPASHFRAVKYRGGKKSVTLTLQGLGKRTWNRRGRWLVDSTAWSDTVMEQFLDNPDWQIINGYLALKIY